MTTEQQQSARERKSHIFEREEYDHYVEPEWVSARLFEEEEFEGGVLDPCCGWGRILAAAKARGHRAIGSDIVDRGAASRADIEFMRRDFFATDQPRGTHLFWRISNIVTNPPFNRIREVTERAVTMTAPFKGKVAVICPVRRLPAATWLQRLPLKRVLAMTPRPSMPSGSHIEAGGKVGGGTVDYAWLVFECGYRGSPKFGWLHRHRFDLGGV
jgi:hypothetical protein